MAFAAARMAEACLKGMDGSPAVECAYVASDVVPGVPYFASKVTLGRKGVEKVHPVGDLSAYEKKALEGLKSMLLENIQAGIDFAQGAGKA